MRQRLIDILMSINTPSNIKLIPTWMVMEIADALIKEGILLPTFKIGDIVWVYDDMWGIIPCKIDRPYHCCAGEEGSCTFEMSFTEGDIGDLVFATKEDAEIYWHTSYEGTGKNLYHD